MPKKPTDPRDLRWPADKVERWPIDRLRPAEVNPRLHSARHVQQIVASMRQWGWTNPVLVDEDGQLIAGHGRLLAAMELGLDEVPVMVAEGWTSQQKRAFVVADNQLTIASEWDEEALAGQIGELKIEGFDLDLLGFEDFEIDSLLDAGSLPPPRLDMDQHDDDTGQTEEEDEDELERSDGSLLSMIDITIDEPRHEVHKGEVWSVGGHLLFVVSVTRDWSTWAKHLDSEEAIFCPYPGPFVPLGLNADQQKLIMVQPDRYVAGHLLDRYADVHGEDAVSRVEVS